MKVLWTVPLLALGALALAACGNGDEEDAAKRAKIAELVKAYDLVRAEHIAATDKERDYSTKVTLSRAAAKAEPENAELKAAAEEAAQVWAELSKKEKELGAKRAALKRELDQLGYVFPPPSRPDTAPDTPDTPDEPESRGG